MVVVVPVGFLTEAARPGRTSNKGESGGAGGLGEGGAKRRGRHQKTGTTGGGTDEPGGVSHKRAQSGDPERPVGRRAELAPSVQVVARVALQFVGTIGRNTDKEYAQSERAQCM